MKRLYYILLIIIILIPYSVKGENCYSDNIKIESLIFDSKSEKASQIGEPTAEDNNINLGIGIVNIGDYVQYKLVIKNISNKDEELKNGLLNSNDDSIVYSLSFSDGNNIIKANSSKEVILKVEYKNKIEPDLLVDGTYTGYENITTNFLLNDGIDSSSNVPDTFIGPKLIVILLFIFILGYILYKFNYKNFYMLLMLLVLLTPVYVIAVCTGTIRINTMIKIVEESNEPHSFSTDSWATIKQAINTNNTSLYNIGDTRSIDLGSLGKHTLRIVNKSTPGECLNDDFSKSACGFVIEFTDIIVIAPMNTTDTNVGGWKESMLRNEELPLILSYFPESVQKAISNTKVITGHGSTEGEENTQTEDKLYFFSPMEIWGDNSNSQFDSAKSQTRQLDYYNSLNISNDSFNEHLIKTLDGKNEMWWLRTPGSKYDINFRYVNSTGSSYGAAANIFRGVSPAFKVS